MSACGKAGSSCLGRRESRPAGPAWLHSNTVLPKLPSGRDGLQSRSLELQTHEMCEDTRVTVPRVTEVIPVESCLSTWRII